MTENVEEPNVRFKAISDRSQFLIRNAETENVLIEISGYDLQINFNMEYINSVEDVEIAVGGIGDLFRKIILERLLEYKKQT